MSASDVLDAARKVREDVAETRRWAQQHPEDLAGIAERYITTDLPELIPASLFLAERLDHATLLTISSEMVELLIAASATIPMEHPLQKAELPWETAFALLETPVHIGKPPPPPPPGSALAHFPHDTDPPVHAVAWTSEEGKVLAGGTNGVLSLGYHTFLGVLTPFMYELRPFGRSLEGLDGDDEIHRFLTCLWVMVQQRIAVTRTVQPPRATSRRWARTHNTKPPAIIEITLRRPAGAPAVDCDGRTVNWSHRWIVGGHWRNQYLPATHDHRPTWIAPYVKGPNDKPLVAGQKVYAWKR